MYIVLYRIDTCRFVKLLMFFSDPKTKYLWLGIAIGVLIVLFVLTCVRVKLVQRHQGKNNIIITVLFYRQ